MEVSEDERSCRLAYRFSGVLSSSQEQCSWGNYNREKRVMFFYFVLFNVFVCFLSIFTIFVVVVVFHQLLNSLKRKMAVVRIVNDSVVIPHWHWQCTKSKTHSGCIACCHCDNTGVEQTLSKSQHRKWSVEEKIILLFLQRIKLVPFHFRVCCITSWAVLMPPATGGATWKSTNPIVVFGKVHITCFCTFSVTLIC